MLKRILLLVDSSPQMRVAGDYAVDLAREQDAQLLLCPLAEKSVAVAALEQNLSQISRQSQESELAYELISTSPLPFSESLAWARSADLAVIAYNAPIGAERTEKRIVRLLTEGACPVYLPIAPDPAAKTVVVAWDGAGSAARALKLHIQLFRRARMRYLLVHLNENPEEAQWCLEQGQELLQAHGAHVDTLALSGDAARRIMAICLAVNPRHLVLGPHGEKLLSKRRLGETSKKLLRSRMTSLFVYA